MMEPIRRPFADWVEGRVVPFFEDHPWAGRACWWGIVSLLYVRSWVELLAVAGLVAILNIGAIFGGVSGALEWVSTFDERQRERRLERLREQKICMHCGYDVRATPQRCPECGKEPWVED